MVLDKQMIGVLGKLRLAGDLVRDGFETSELSRDNGTDLLVHLPGARPEICMRTRPIQIKSSWDEAFGVDRKYEKVPDLMLVYVWHLRDRDGSETYAMTYQQAVKIAEQMGWTSTDSWKKGRYVTTAPSKRLRELLLPHRVEAGCWRDKLFSGRVTDTEVTEAK